MSEFMMMGHFWYETFYESNVYDAILMDKNSIVIYGNMICCLALGYSRIFITHFSWHNRVFINSAILFVI
jgi:hypothetical protein